jgi:Ras-related protein Rab-8A
MGVLLVYDVSDAGSFANVRSWVKNVEAHASDGVARMLVGNKADVGEGRRAVSTEAGAALAAEYGIPFYETSAKSGARVEEAFLRMARDVAARLREAPPDGGGGGGGGPTLRVGGAPRAGASAQRAGCCS